MEYDVPKMIDVTRSEMGLIIANKSSRFNISGTNGFMMLKIGQQVTRAILNIVTKFHRCNCWVGGEICNFGSPFTFSNISCAHGIVELKIDRQIARGALSSILKFRGNNYWS